MQTGARMTGGSTQDSYSLLPHSRKAGLHLAARPEAGGGVQQQRVALLDCQVSQLAAAGLWWGAARAGREDGGAS